MFFGCRYSGHDSLYQKELEEFKSAGMLRQLYAAFSRENDKGVEKTYVQTVMENDKACGDHLVKMIMEKGALVYVCGDGNDMGKDVQEAVTALLAAKLSTSSSESEAKENAAAYMNQMKATGCFVLDIWS